MTRWGVFVLLAAGYIYASIRFIPAEHRKVYAQCRQTPAFWVGNLLPHAIWITALAQNVISPSAPSPFILQLAAAITFAYGGALIIAARRVNVLFVAPIVYVPPHLRVTAWPYSVSKHPGYQGMWLLAVGECALLGQSWAFVPTLAYLSLILYRTRLENRLLNQ